MSVFLSPNRRLSLVGRVILAGLVVLAYFVLYTSKTTITGWIYVLLRNNWPAIIHQPGGSTIVALLYLLLMAVINLPLSLLLIYALTADLVYARMAFFLYAVLWLLALLSVFVKHVVLQGNDAFPGEIISILLRLLYMPVLPLILAGAYGIRKKPAA